MNEVKTFQMRMELRVRTCGPKHALVNLPTPRSQVLGLSDGLNKYQNGL